MVTNMSHLSLCSLSQAARDRQFMLKMLRTRSMHTTAKLCHLDPITLRKKTLKQLLRVAGGRPRDNDVFADAKRIINGEAPKRRDTTDDRVKTKGKGKRRSGTPSEGDDLVWMQQYIDGAIVKKQVPQGVAAHLDKSKRSEMISVEDQFLMAMPKAVPKSLVKTPTPHGAGMHKVKAHTSAYEVLPDTKESKLSQGKVPVKADASEEKHLRNITSPVIKDYPADESSPVNEIRIQRGKFETSDDILKAVTKSSLSDQIEQLANEMKSNITKMKELKLLIDESQRRERDANKASATAASDLKREDLENFLKEAKLNKDRDEENHFREVRRFETMKNMNSSRTLDKKNFFSPVDENLIRSVRRGFVPMTENKTSDDLFFPTLPQMGENITHEFMVVVDGKRTIVKESPFGPHYRAPDLVTLFHEIGSNKKLLKQAHKFEQRKWKLIGTRPADDVLVFERYIDKDKESRRKRKTWALRFGWSFVGLYALGTYFDQEHSLTHYVYKGPTS